MNKTRYVLAFLLATLAIPGVLPAAGLAAPTAIATQLLDHLDARDYAAAEALFNPEMATAVPADKLKTVWESLPTQAGAAKGRGDPVVATQAGVTLVTVPLHYVAVELVAKIAVAPDGKIAGFLIQPAQAPAAAIAAVPVDANYRERELNIGDGEHSLPATLSMPKGADTSAKGVAAVVLVHGSGPQDRNETIGPNRPLLDIARGLAEQGIAVLRYEKRTTSRPQDYADGVTIDSETTDDAVAAIAALRTIPGTDPERVFVLGHSQGAMMAPRIAAHAAQAGTPVAGLILLAAPARKLLDILIEQNQRMAVLDDGHTSVEEAAALQALRAQVQAVRAGGDVPIEQSPMNQPADYWRSTDAVDPVADARADRLPMLILQGARDIQVVDADWQQWNAGFHDDPQVVFKLYPALNHLGIAGEGDGNLAEYATPGHVDVQLIADVATWIAAH